MILQPVELTKIRYYNDGKEASIPTISREILDNQFNRNVIIKKNIFGHKWVLKINETKEKKRCRWKLHVYVVVFSCIIVAVGFGIFFTVTDNSPKNQTKTVLVDFQLTVTPPTNVTSSTEIYKMYCKQCRKNQICMKLSETEVPKCVDALDRKDPTGCGGLCSINTQYCQPLDRKNEIYQCSNLKNILKCPKGSFNCGNMCIDVELRCDGIVHCSNKSDEQSCDCDLETHFRCTGISCLPKQKKCDGVVDCWDKSDERNCTQNGCQPDYLPCLNGDCIPKDGFCNGHFDCHDKSDEPKGCK